MRRTLAILVAAGSMLLAVATASPALADHGGGGGGQPPQGTALQSELYGASCTSASACTAVGDYVTNTGASKTLAERWNGTAWTLQSTPNPSGASYLNGVSCTSASACTAVGWYVTSTNATLTLAENWNGTTWTVQSTPNPSGAAHSFLQDVACTSASACTATGYYATSAGVDQALAESWNGTTWTLQSTPTPSGATSSGLSGVSCTSASACTSVGWYGVSPGAYETLAETWNGTTWAIQSTPNRTAATSSYLFGVSCTSASACTATGYDLSPNYTALAERWNGTTWALQSTPNP